MKPYPEYKDLGVEWIGKIPGHWNLKKLKYLLPLVNTKSIDGNLPKIALENISSWTGKLIESDSQFEGEGTLFEKDDILFGKLRPYLAKVWKSTFSGSAVGDIFILRPNKYIYPDFAFYRLVSTQYIHIINGSTFGAKMPRASWDFIGDLPYPFPLIPEQKQIAKYLDHKTAQIDSLIEKKKRLIELLREERTAVINQAVTKGLDPNVPMKDSGIEWLGEIPAYWEVKKLKRSTTKITDGEHISPAFSSEGMPFLSAKDVRERDLNFDGDKFVSVEDGNKFRKRCDPERGDILLVSRGATIGRVGLVETDEKFCLLGSVILLKPIAKYSSLFLFYVLNTSRIQEQLLLTSQSSAQQAIYLVGVSELQIPVPPLDEQNLLIKHIEAEIIRIDTIISKSEKEIELLQEYRTALISEVVTGKIDVREERI